MTYDDLNLTVPSPVNGAFATKLAALRSLRVRAEPMCPNVSGPCLRTQRAHAENTLLLCLPREALIGKPPPIGSKWMPSWRSCNLSSNGGDADPTGTGYV
jgi:hypothetical protein